MPVLPQSARRLLLLLLLLLLATTTAALPPPPPFQVPTPYGTLAYNVIEESRVLFLKLTTRGRSSFIPSSVGPIHVLRCPGKRGATLPPVMLVHGVCATGHDFLPLLNGLRKGCSEVRAASLSSDWLTVVFSFSFIPPPTHPPHVIPHISTHTGHDFLPLLNGLRKCCSEIIVLDLPGHGKSGIHVDDPDFQTLVASVVDVIQHTIITTTPPPPTPPTTAAPATSDTKPPRRNEKTALPTSSPSPPKILLVGNSLGGLVAIRVALQIPHHIAALCLLSPAGAPLTEDELTEVKRLFQLQNQAEGLAFVERVCAFPERLPKALRAIMSWACRMRTSSGAIHVIMNKAQPSHMLSKKDLRGLRDTPTLFVWGKHEKVLHAHGLLFFKRYLSSKSTAFCCEEEFGHVPFLDDPKRLLAIMQGFFEGTCSGKGIKGGEVVVGA